MFWTRLLIFTYVVYVKALVVEMADKNLFICFFISIVRFSCGDIDYSKNGTVYYTAGQVFLFVFRKHFRGTVALCFTRK